MTLFGKRIDRYLKHISQGYVKIMHRFQQRENGNLKNHFISSDKSQRLNLTPLT